MRTVQSTVKTNIGNNQQKVVVKTTTYMKVGDLIGTAKTAYDLGKVLRRKAGNIKKTLKQYGVEYINNMLTPLIALITGMDVYKTIMSVIEVATPIAKTVARATTAFPHAGNVADIASIVLSTVTKIIVQLATIFLLKMKEMIWNFEFKIREVSNQYVIEQIAMATRSTINMCSNIVIPSIPSIPDLILDNIDGIDLSINVPIPPTLFIDGLNIYYSDENEGIKYMENGEWHQTNFTDGSFQPCKKLWNGILFAFSYEGKNADSKPYGIVYSLNKGKHWEYLNPDDKDYYVYDAAIFGDNINFSQYTDVLKRGEVRYEKREYKAIDPILETANPKEVYIVEGDKSTFYILDENEEMIEADRYTMSEKNKKLIIKPQRIISCTLKYEDNVFTAGDFEDEKTPDGTLVETLMNHDIKYYGDDSCVETLNFMYETVIPVNTEISANVFIYRNCNVSEITTSSEFYFDIWG